MTFPEPLDYDKVAYAAYVRIGNAIKGWVDGAITTEEPLLNRLTEQFQWVPRKCDVGISEPMTMRVDWAILHRQGEKQRDAFGADLAVTIYVDGLGLVKTALFQTKISEDCQATLEKRQLLQGVDHSLTRSRSFVLAIDKNRHNIRVAKTESLLEHFDGETERKQFACDAWTPFGVWLWQWFSCDVGENSRRNDPKSIETLLQKHVIETNRPKMQGSPWGSQEYAGDIVDDLPPAKMWLMLFFADPESAWIRG